MELKINNEMSLKVADITGVSSTNDLVKQILLMAHPIGSYYWSENSTNPSELFGGTWIQIKDKYILAIGDTYKAGESYGAATHTHTSAAHTHTINGHTHTTGNHTLTVNEIPSHIHGAGKYDGAWMNNNAVQSGPDYQAVIINGVNNGNRMATSSTGGSGAHSHGNTGSTSLTTNSTTPGNTGSSSNIPPSITAYCWKRTA